MNTNSILKKEGIEINSKLDSNQIKKIAQIISQKICEAFPEHNLNIDNLFDTISTLDMFIAKMPDTSVAAKYFSKNNAIYFSDKIDWNNIDTLAIHESLHAIQEIKNSRGKLLKLGLYDVISNKGQGINEASVQLMAAKATHTPCDTVKYYNMNFSTPSPLYYPIETALMQQIIYFTGSYPLFHSTLHSNNIFKNTFISKCNEKTYHTIETNFDLLLRYEEQLSFYSSALTTYSEYTTKQTKIKKLNAKINSIKSSILEITIATQNLIMEHCFESEFEAIRDNASLNHFQQRLYEFHSFLITTDSYSFYQSFYCKMRQRLEEKRQLLKEFGVLNYLNDLQTDLLDLEQDNFGLKFFRRLFDKLKLLFEESIRNKNEN